MQAVISCSSVLPYSPLTKPIDYYYWDRSAGKWKIFSHQATTPVRLHHEFVGG